MAQFELSWVGEYIPQAVAENDFLNEKLESDTYGIYYSVQFQGNAETYLMQAKIPPEVGKPEWGMLKKSKSGKSIRLERVKREEGHPAGGITDVFKGGKPEEKYLKDVSDVPRSLVIELLKYYDVQSLWNSPKYTEMINLAQSLNDDIVSMITGNRSGSQSGGGLQLTDSPKATNELKSPAAAADKQKLQEIFGKPEYGDEDAPYNEE